MRKDTNELIERLQQCERIIKNYHHGKQITPDEARYLSNVGSETISLASIWSEKQATMDYDEEHYFKTLGRDPHYGG